MFRKKKSVYNHNASTIAKACKISQKTIKRKHEQINDFIVDSQLKSNAEISRSRVVEKLEQLYTKRELAFIVQQYSEMIQKGEPRSPEKELVNDPSVY